MLLVYNWAMKPPPEHLAYHSLAVSLESSYSRLSALIKKYGTWQRAAEAELKSNVQKNSSLAGDIRLILSSDEEFPPLLKEIPLPPLALYVRGELPPPENSVAVVGTRKATESGRETAAEFAEALTSSGLSIISGLAMGIDGAAHEGALRSGKTWGILGNGPDIIYPRTHFALAGRMLASGGLVSEYPPGTPPLPYRFLERNRIVSGLCESILVIEAPESSGALVTARFALEQNRNVYVLPGPARHPNFRGSNALIRAGATLVSSPEEFLADLGFEPRKAAHLADEDSPETERILALLEHRSGPVPIDEIISEAKLSPADANRILTMLALAGRVREDAGGYTI